MFTAHLHEVCCFVFRGPATAAPLKVSPGAPPRRYKVTVHGSGETSLQRGAGLRGVKQRGPSASSRPRLEALEDRLAPATTITINGTVTLDESPGLQNTGIPVGAEDNNDVVVHVVGYCGSRQSPSPRRQCSVGTKVTRTRPRSFVLAECLSCPLVRDALASVTSRL